MDLKGTEYENMEYIQLPQCRVILSMVMNLWVP